ncbi:MAG TPA: CoA transferase [Xanthobacteraceae bacterium]|nr:CoA transferase [Xanthobacteraceae bacterium]
MNELPLAGIRVVDFTQVMMGPVATQMLGDYGADVIKIERPPTGDLSRTSIPDDPAGLVGPVYCSLNRNKRSMVLDLRKGEDRAALMDLIRTADVVVNNFRAGVMERMGLGRDELMRINPRLIYAVGTGFGLTGPYAHKGGQDVLAQAMSGVMARRSNETDPLAVQATTFADYCAGMHLVQGVLLALLQREKTGRGQQVSVSLLDSMLAAQTQEAAANLMRGRELNWGAMPLSGVFETSDGALVMVGAFKTEPLKDIGAALDLPGLKDDPRFATHALRMANKPALQAMFRERFKTDTTARWIARLEARDLLCAPVRDLAAALADEQTAINGMILEAPGVVETVKVVGSPIHMEDAPVAIRIPPASLGQHTEAVLADLARARAAAAE